MPRDPTTLPRYAITVAGRREPLAFVPATDEADAIRHYCEIQPLALSHKDMLTATRTTRRG